MNIKKLPKTQLANIIGLILSSSTFATLAQDEATKDVKAKNSVLEIIEVTARKRIESVQSIPSSINAVTGDFIKDMGVHNIEDLSKYVPGLEQPNLANHSRLSLRGVSSGDNQSFEQSVGTYVDGVYRGRMNQQRSGFFDMQRVEVLKGPQVTLYGNSSVGGALSMVTNRPDTDDDVNGEFVVKYELEYEEAQIFGGVNIPVTDNFALRIAGKWRDQSKGAELNNYSGQYETYYNDNAFRIGAVWEASDELSFYLRHEQASFEKSGETIALYTHVNPDFTEYENSPLAPFGIGSLNTGNDDSIFENGPSGNKNESNETMLEIIWQINDDISLTSITADSRYDYFHTLDIDAAPYNFLASSVPEDYEQLSQELRLDINVNDQIKLLTGVYYQDADFNTGFDVDFNMPFISTALGLPFELASYSRSNYLEQNAKQHAIFGQLDYQASEKLSLTLGIRYTEIEKTATQGLELQTIEGEFDTREPLPFTKGLSPALFSYWAILKATGAPHEFKDMKREEEHTMISASARYFFTKDFMGYFTFANGAKAGGFDTLYEGPSTASFIGTVPGPSAGTPQDTEFEDEQVTAYEVGFKSDWDNMRLNVAAFYGTYEDLQTSVFSGGTGFNVANAGQTVQKGVDVEFIWQVTDELSFSANAEYLDFYYDEFTQAACSLTEMHNGEQNADGKCDWSGDSLAWVPKLAAFVKTEHITEIFNNYEMSNMLSINYKSEHTIDSSNEQGLVQDGYALVDYRFKLTPINSDWYAAITVSNLFDEDYEIYLAKIPLNIGAYGSGVHQKARKINLEFGMSF